MLFERKVLCKIYSFKRNEENIYEPKTNVELRTMFNEPDIIGLLKRKRISWAEHI